MYILLQAKNTYTLISQGSSVTYVLHFLLTIWLFASESWFVAQ